MHRLRLEGRIAELRSDTITFDAEEAHELFALLGIELSASDIAGLVARTQGWAAGLRLAALGAAYAEDPSEYIRTLSGRTGYIADYLMREVYQKLSTRWQDFLDTVSIVDVVCADLATAVGAGTDSAEILAELARQNAFVHELGNRPGWYRLHPLLLDFLRSRVSDAPRRLRLNRGAAQWFMTQGHPLTALRHALAAQDWELAGQLIGTHVVTWTVRRPPDELARTLSALPREAVLTHAGLAMGLAAARTMAAQPDGVQELVDATASQIHQIGGRRRRRYDFLLELIAFGNARWTGDLESVLAGCRRMPTDPAVLGTLGMADWAAIAVLLVSNAGSCEMWLGEQDSAQRHLRYAAEQDLGPQIVLPILNARAHLAYLLWEQGELTGAETMARTALDGFSGAGLAQAVQAAPAYLALSGVALDRDDLAAAGDWLRLFEPTGREPHTALAARMMEARLLRATGRGFDAMGVVKEALSASGRWPLPARLVREAELLRAALETGTPQAGEPSGGEVAGGDPSAGAAPDTVRGRVLGALDDALAGASDDPSGQADQTPHGSTSREARLAALEESLRAASGEGLRRPFLDAAEAVRPLLVDVIERGTADPSFAVDLLSRMSDPQPGPKGRRHALLMPLSARETHVLRFLATSMTNHEIAEAMYVSVNTIKTHQRSIYQKLGATSRREAVTHAREAGLI